MLATMLKQSRSTLPFPAIAGGWAAGAGVVTVGVCASTAPVCVGVAALIGGVLAGKRCVGIQLLQLENGRRSLLMVALKTGGSTITIKGSMLLHPALRPFSFLCLMRHYRQ